MSLYLHEWNKYGIIDALCHGSRTPVRPRETWQFVEFLTRFDEIQYKSSREFIHNQLIFPGNICQLHFLYLLAVFVITKNLYRVSKYNFL